jgi:hypothetical protein
LKTKTLWQQQGLQIGSSDQAQPVGGFCSFGWEKLAAVDTWRPMLGLIASLKATRNVPMG